MHLFSYVLIVAIVHNIIIMKIILYGGLWNLFVMLVMANDTDSNDFCAEV